MSSSSTSGDFWFGTLIFTILALLSTCSGSFCFRGKNRQLVILLTPVAFLCMWLMWALTWLMQWHPLIVPITENK